MASIIGLEEQKNALNIINGTIKDVESLNGFMAANNPSGEFTLIMFDDNNTKLKTKIRVPDKTSVDSLLAAHKVRTRDYVLELAEKYQIALTDSDKQILGMHSESYNH